MAVKKKSSSLTDKQTVLVVDDDNFILELLHNIIAREGHTCFRAHDAKFAMGILKKDPVDVVITDINMPGLTGIELNQIINEKYDTDVIIMSGDVDAFAFDQVVAQGASDFIQKPFSNKELILRLNRVLNERKTIAERNNAEKELYLSIKKQNKIIENIINAMALTVETRDPYTAGHQTRVAKLARAIAKDMGLSKEHQDQIHMAGIIHDLGKIAIPAEILSYPGKLTNHQFGIIKSHPIVGYNILKTIEFPWPIANIVYQHHEKLDGSGYPLGLTENDILLEAKILSVADVVEAIASHRPYRASLGIDFALEEIVKNKNRFFDKTAVESCVSLFSKSRFQFDD